MQLPIILISLMAKKRLRDRPGSLGTSPRPVILTLSPVSPDSSEEDTAIDQTVCPAKGPCPESQKLTFNFLAVRCRDVGILTQRVKLDLEEGVIE